jgi:hypothetical protein
MQMVRHVAVRSQRELLADRGAQNLRTHNLDAITINERVVPLICAERQEISVGADVVERFETLWSSRQHASRRATGEPSRVRQVRLKADTTSAWSG